MNKHDFVPVAEQWCPGAKLTEVYSEGGWVRYVATGHYTEIDYERNDDGNERWTMRHKGTPWRGETPKSAVREQSAWLVYEMYFGKSFTLWEAIRLWYFVGLKDHRGVLNWWSLRLWRYRKWKSRRWSRRQDRKRGE